MLTHFTIKDPLSQQHIWTSFIKTIFMSPLALSDMRNVEFSMEMNIELTQEWMVRNRGIVLEPPDKIVEV